MPGSLTVVQRAWENPDDEDAWKDLQNRYRDLIYAHAVGKLHLDRQAAGDLTVQVFRNLHRRFKNRKLGPIEMPRGTLQSYVRDAVESARRDVVRADARRRQAEAAAARRDDGGGADPIAELDAAIDYREQFDNEVARCTDLYPEKLKSVHAADLTWEMFLRVELNGETAAHLDKVYGYNRPGTVAQYVRQVRDRLFDLLGLSHASTSDKDRSTAILREVVRRHEQPHSA